MAKQWTVKEDSIIYRQMKEGRKTSDIIDAAYHKLKNRTMIAVMSRVNLLKKQRNTLTFKEFRLEIKDNKLIIHI